MSPAKKIFYTEEEKAALAMKRSHTERFKMLMKLIRISNMLKNARIINNDTGLHEGQKT